MMTGEQEISLIAPIHNEEDNIEELSQRAEEVLDELVGSDGWEFLLVNDASTDHSAGMLNRISSRRSNFRIFHHDRVLGQTGGFKTGFDHARGRISITIDGDLQLFPEDIPLLYNKLQEGYELVNAIRSGRRHHLTIVLSSRIYNLLMRIFFRCPVSDAASNFTAVVTERVRGLRLTHNDHRYLIPILQSRGLTRISEIPVRHAPRLRGSSKYSITKALTGFPELLYAWWRVRSGYYRD